MTNPVAYAVVRFGRPEHHMVSNVYRDEWVAADLAWRGNTGLAIAYAGYAFANVGLYMVAIR